MRIFQNLNIDFLGKRTIFYFISAILILLGFLNILTRGLHLGIDFKGGTEIALQFEKPIDITQIRNDVDNLGLGSVEVKTFGSSNDILLRTDLQEIPANVIPKVKSKIESIISNTFPGLQKRTTDSTSTTITITFPDSRTAEILNNKLFEAGFQTSKAIDDTANTSVIVRLTISDLLKENLSAMYKGNP
ncbi:MAG: protein translocase subunit SecF, partial [Bacteroidota bacterium]